MTIRAPICTGSILVYTANVDITQNQNFPSSYPIPLIWGKTKGRELVLKLPNLLNQQTQMFPWDWDCITTKRNSTCSKCPLIQNGECSLGYSYLHRKPICSAIPWGGCGVSLRAVPQHSAQLPQPASRSFTVLQGTTSPGTSHTWHRVESPLSHMFIHKTTALWGRADQN